MSIIIQTVQKKCFPDGSISNVLSRSGTIANLFGAFCKLTFSTAK